MELMIAPVHENTNAPQVLLKVCDVIFCKLAKHIIGDLSRFFEGVSIFVYPKNCPSPRSGQFGGHKSLGPLEKPLEITDYRVYFALLKTINLLLILIVRRLFFMRSWSVEFNFAVFTSYSSKSSSV
jgi:hypothetical protein